VRVRAALGGVVVLALLGLGTAVVGAMLTPGGQTVAVPLPSGAVNESSDGASSGGDVAGGRVGEVVVLHVLGAVLEPGIVELSLGSRVVDAIAAARGPTDLADLSAVNLARIVADGEQLVVPRIGEVPAAGGAGAGAGGAVDSQGRVNINTANATELTNLAGVGPALAARIISWREQNGPFRSIEELTAVSGIGPKTLDGMRDQVTL
jgi:competence protein ComEA